MAGAVIAVFDTAELLEGILLMLRGTVDSHPTRKIEMRTLLRCLRVSKVFKATIDNSPKLQRRLFFRPQLATSPEPILILGPGSPRYLDILRSINPLLYQERVLLDTVQSSIEVGVSVGFRPMIAVTHTRTVTSRQSISRAGLEGGSWRRMLLCQTTSLTDLGWQAEGWDARCKSLFGQLSLERDVTMGELVDRCLFWEQKDKTPRRLRYKVQQIPDL